MVETSAELLNGRLTHFISYNLGWTELSPIQEKAIPMILEGNDTLVIAPTASGKTEAVLLPIFSEIISKGLDPTSVIYISPLKALINDMHERIEKWANHFYLNATKWHGDVNTIERNKFIKNPTDFLSITPESLEVILMNRSDKSKMKIFHNIKYIIIDEIHYFADSDRGTQLNSLINRISKYSQYDIQKIGLSATVGNPNTIAKWINHKEPAKVVIDDSSRVSQYKILNIHGEELVKYLSKYKNKKILVFCRSRKDTEVFYSLFSKYSLFQNIFIHHSSLDKDTRERSERGFKEAEFGIMFSTSTLELGIDIGDIDLVVQIEPPNNISSFLQRVGRSGRRSGEQKSFIISSGFGLLVSLAELILINKGKIENIIISDKSKDLLFHQILSSIFYPGKVKYKDLYTELTNCYSFSNISKKEYVDILNEMKRLEFIEKYGEFITLGLSFEKIFGRMNFLNFYSVFCPTFEYVVKERNKNIGSLDIAFVAMLKEGSLFKLGGKTWRVTYIDGEEYYLKVERTRDDANAPSWTGEGPPLSYLISRKIYDVLTNNFERDQLKSLDDKSAQDVEFIIQRAKENNFEQNLVPVHINGRTNVVHIYSFAGDKANNLFLKIISLYHDISNDYVTPYYIKFKAYNGITIEDIESIYYDLENILEREETINLLDQLVGKFYKNKFINYLPKEDEIDLKLHLLFDKEGLLDLVKNNSIVELKYNTFVNVLNDLVDDDSNDGGEENNIEG